MVVYSSALLSGAEEVQQRLGLSETSQAIFQNSQLVNETGGQAQPGPHRWCPLIRACYIAMNRVELLPNPNVVNCILQLVAFQARL